MRTALWRLMLLSSLWVGVAASVTLRSRILRPSVAPPAAFPVGVGGLLLSSHDLQAEHASVFRGNSSGKREREWMDEESLGLLGAPDADDEPPIVAYVWTAKAAPSATSTRPPGEQRRRARYDARKKATELSEALGVQMRPVDIAEDASKWEDFARSCDAVYVAGGNTFWLHHHMSREGGLYDILLGRRSAAESFLYVGISAGGIVAGSERRAEFVDAALPGGDTVDPALWKGWDNPHLFGDDVIIDWSKEHGLGWAGPGVEVFPHFDSQWGSLVAGKVRDWDAQTASKTLLVLKQRGCDTDLCEYFTEDGTFAQDLATTGAGGTEQVDDTEPGEIIFQQFGEAERIAWRPERQARGHE
eukprot:scaffold3504_cov240-Pinguiococcus_pyrenoidosus.AAC.39